MKTSRRALLVVVAATALLAATVAALAAFAPIYAWVHHAPRDTAALLGDQPLVIAHRGWSAVAPENTLAAFRAAAELGVGFELDVGLCASGEAVVLHDKTLDRTTTGTGPLAEAPLDHLRTLDAGAWFDTSFAGEPLPTLADVLAELGGEVVIDIELKTADDKAALAAAVVADVTKAGLLDRVFVSSFDPFLLEQVRLADPTIVRGQLVGDFERSDLAWYEKRLLQNLAFNGGASPDLVIAQHDWLTAAWVEFLHARGYRVLVYTVNEPAAVARALEMGVDGIVTDTPDRFASAKDR